MSSVTSVIKSSAPLLMQGAAMTVGLWLVSIAISLSMGCAWGVLRCKWFQIPMLSPVIDVLTFMLRGIPFYVQLLIAYFVLPALLNVDLPPFVIATSALGLCSSAYVSQIVKGAINAVPVGQWEAAQVLGFSRLQTLRYIIMPQVIAATLPALIGEGDQVLKSTSIFSAIGMLELTRVAMNIIARTMNPIPIYGFIAFIYLVISALLNVLAFKVDQTMNKRIRR